jgi:DNA-binding winged helix-turn-helix (wHTH) protein
MLDSMEGIYEFGPFRLETVERRLLRDGRPIRLRGKVFDTLCVLVSRPGRLVEKDDLMAAVWPDTVVEENNLAHNINALRKALGDGTLIETVPGKGYRFAGTACLAAAAPAPRTVETPSDTPLLIEREGQMKSLQEAFAEALGGRGSSSVFQAKPGWAKRPF